MDNLKSIFSREKVGSRPQPPTIRQIYEDLKDLECQKNDDPIFLAGKLIRAYKQGKIGHKESGNEDGDGAVAVGDGKFHFKTDEEKEMEKLYEEIQLKSPNFLDNIIQTCSPLQQNDHPVTAEAAEGESLFRKFKYLVNVCEQSQEIQQLIEPQLDKLRQDIEDFKNPPPPQQDQDQKEPPKCDIAATLDKKTKATAGTPRDDDEDECGWDEDDVDLDDNL